MIVELVGPAGAGKTTLARELTRRDPGIREGLRLTRARHLRYWLSCLVRFAPLLAGGSAPAGPILDRGRLRSMAYLEGWLGEARRGDAFGTWAVLLDHGPLYRLAQLQASGSPPSFEQWWNGMRSRWLDTLDLVFWLDAPGDVLSDRIVARPRWHVTKDLSQEERDGFVAGQRAALANLVDDVARLGRSRVVRLDTERDSIEAVADRAMAALTAHRRDVSAGRS